MPKGAAPMDAAPMDEAPMDVAPMDAGPMDAAPMDAGPMDVVPMDVVPKDEATNQAPLRLPLQPKRSRCSTSLKRLTQLSTQLSCSLATPMR